MKKRCRVPSETNHWSSSATTPVIFFVTVRGTFFHVAGTDAEMYTVANVIAAWLLTYQ